MMEVFYAGMLAGLLTAFVLFLVLSDLARDDHDDWRY